MSLLSRIRLDVALGVLTAGAVLYAYRKDLGATVGFTGSSERKRKREEIETLDALAPLMMDPANLDLTERVLMQCDPQTIIRVASTSKYLSEIIANSLSIQLRLRRYFHKLPPVLRPSAQQAKSLSLPKREQLDRLIEREEKLSRFRHTKLQRCSMPYIDVLCSGDYMIITRSLHSRFRIPDVPESGPVEDGFTVMVPEEGREKGKEGLEGYRDWTVDVGGEIADIGVRSDEDLIVIATFLDDSDTNVDGESPVNSRRTVRVAFYHLEVNEPHPTDPDRRVLVPHAEAKYKTADFELDAEECRSIRLRSGPRGKLLIWAKHEEGCLHSRSIVYDWKAGVPVASPWINDGVQYGLPHDFTFCAPSIILASVLTTTKSSKRDLTPAPGSADQQTRLEIQVLKLPPAAHAAHTPGSSQADGTQSKRFLTADFPRCTHVASFRFPNFTHRWQNPGPSDDEVLPVPDGQTFRLIHSSIAAKPSPGTNQSGDDQGLLCITIEGDFGPVTHPDGGAAHDHGVIAFCTIAGSVFSKKVFETPRWDQPKVVDYDDWSRGHVSWDFGPGNTWVTGYGTRTTSVSRMMGFTHEMDDLTGPPPDPDNAKRSIITNVRLRDYNPIAVSRKGRVSKRPLGRQIDTQRPIGDTPDTGIANPGDPADMNANIMMPEDLLNLVNLTRHAHPPAAFPQLNELTDLFANMAAATTNDTFRVVAKSEARLPEMFQGTVLHSSLPFYEANVFINIDEERDEAAMEHPFKTILARDRLIVCDDGGFDIFYF